VRVIQKGVGDHVSISSTFYVQLLRTQIPKVQKDTDDLTVFFTLLGFMSKKAARKTLVKLTPGREGVERLIKTEGDREKK